jgi:hypothetical protein
VAELVHHVLFGGRSRGIIVIWLGQAGPEVSRLLWSGTVNCDVTSLLTVLMDKPQCCRLTSSWMAGHAPVPPIQIDLMWHRVDELAGHH